MLSRVLIRKDNHQVHQDQVLAHRLVESIAAAQKPAQVEGVVSVMTAMCLLPTFRHPMSQKNRMRVVQTSMI